MVIPDDFAFVLKEYPQALSFFESLSYSNKRRLVESILAAKTSDTRLKRIAVTTEKLKQGKI